MKKFLGKLLIYIALLSGITLGINEIYKQQGGEYDKFVKGVPDGLQICNFGSSHSRAAFTYDEIGKKYVCFNFGLAEQSLPYDYRILVNYKDKLQNNAAVFIVISYFSLFGPSVSQEKDFASKNKRYYKFLPPELIYEYDARTNFYVNYFPALADEKLISIFQHVYSFFRKPPETSGVRLFTPELAEKEIIYEYTRHVAANVDSHGIRIRKDDALEALYSMIQLCREKGARPILLTTPYLHEYVDIVKKNDPKFFEDFYGIINKVVGDTGAEYYDYSSDERYTNNYALFRDTHHLNKKGAKIFTDNIMREVLGIEP